VPAHQFMRHRSLYKINEVRDVTTRFDFTQDLRPSHDSPYCVKRDGQEPGNSSTRKSSSPQCAKETSFFLDSSRQSPLKCVATATIRNCSKLGLLADSRLQF